MEILHALPEVPFSDSVVTIGTFDGVHLGHRKVLETLVAAAQKRGVPSVAITFTNHPKDVLRPERPLERLTTPEQKNSGFEAIGVDILIALTFTPELSKMSASEFLNEVKESLAFSHLVLGHDARFGRGREGDRAFVASKSEEMNYTFEYLDALRVHELVVSSTEIRLRIREGNLGQAMELLGRFYSLEGEVIHGDGRGKSVGYPTANIEIVGRCLPPYGVYAITSDFDGAHLHGIANLGISPTLKTHDQPLLEVHLFDFDGDLYGKRLQVELHRFIRPESKFSGVDELRDQIARDIEVVKGE